MPGFWHSVGQILSQDMMVHVYSSPNIFMEILVIFFMCLLHILLLLEVNMAIEEISMPPLNILKDEGLKSTDSGSSIFKGDIITHPEFGVDVVFKQDGIVKKNWDTMTKINKILSTSMSEFIRRDLKKIKSKIKEEDDEQVLYMSTNQSSTEKLYDYLFQEPDMQSRLATLTEAVKKR